ncbi:phage portal protein [Lysinibacillus sp. LZ02]|uniref:phage portal protein n=1 Tax=Lysinibacillus sp. LZ02 TaxID=3420668 RepID=UPI003D36A086
MGFLKWVKEFFLDDRNGAARQYLYEAAVEAAYKNFAISVCIDLIANTLSKCEFHTFVDGKTMRGENYYLFNVQPNQNQNASEFIYDFVSKFFYENEALIIMKDEQLYIADSFSVTDYAFYENVYKDVVVNDYKLQKTFVESEVIHLKLRDKKIIDAIDSLYKTYGKLLGSAMNYYRRKNNKRYLMKMDHIRAQDEETQAELDALIEAQLKNWFDPKKEGVVFQLQEGMELQDMSSSKDGKDSNSRDISNLVHDIFDFVSMAFHVPKNLLKGDLADLEKQVDSFIMFAISPFAELITDEYNRKIYSKEEFLKRTYMKVDTSKIKLLDIVQAATAYDKFFAIGGMTINELLQELGKNPIDEDWANERFITKNYQKASIAYEGGE